MSLPDPPVTSTISELPQEMIIEIISKFDEIEDLRNCMLISKDIRDLIFKSFKIMRKIKMSFKASTTVADVSEFIVKYGRFIKNIVIKSDDTDPEQSGEVLDPHLVPFILSQTKNLENFAHESQIYIIPKTEIVINHPFSLPKLQHLSIPTFDASNFLNNARDVKNLVTIEIYQNEEIPSEILTNFITDQEVLKELIISTSRYANLHPFPSHDISKAIKFALTKFEYSKNDVNQTDDFLCKFIETQAASLKVLKLSDVDDCKFYEIVFEKCKNLEFLEMHEKLRFAELLDREKWKWILPKLRHFYFGTVRLSSVCWKFPNLLSIECIDLEASEGVFNKLESLKVCMLNCDQVLNSKLNNLKNLDVKHSIIGVHWDTFSQNLPNLENFKLKTSENYPTFLNVLKSLKNFKKLKSFEMISIYDEQILIKIDKEDVRINEGLQEKEEILKVLSANYKNFKF